MIESFGGLMVNGDQRGLYCGGGRLVATCMHVVGGSHMWGRRWRIRGGCLAGSRQIGEDTVYAGKVWWATDPWMGGGHRGAYRILIGHIVLSGRGVVCRKTRRNERCRYELICAVCVCGGRLGFTVHGESVNSDIECEECEECEVTDTQVT